jgi:hypothetical protein
VTDPADDQPDRAPPLPDEVDRGGIVLTRFPTVPAASTVFTRNELTERILALQAKVERETREQRLPPIEDELRDTRDPLDDGVVLSDDELFHRLERATWPRGRSFRADFKSLDCAVCERALLGPSCECVRTEAQLQGLVLARLLPPPARTFRGRPICDDCLEAM